MAIPTLVSFQGPPCAHGVTGTPHEVVHDMDVGSLSQIELLLCEFEEDDFGNHYTTFTTSCHSTLPPQPTP